ncbi:MAG: pyridoxamine 5'-phosphate oxidase family protein [Planctomycetota bacterium]
MSNPRPRPQQLDDVLETLWTELEIGAAKAKHGFHQPVVATVRPDGTPTARTVVLRRCDREAGIVSCHTDARAPKLDHLQCTPSAAWCFYDKGRRVQVRAQGLMTVHTDDDIADEHWSRSPVRSRRCYLAPATPGTIADNPSANLPPDLLDREPSPQESEAGRENFAVLRCTIESFDYLELHHAGHARASFTRRDGGWNGVWIEP